MQELVVTQKVPQQAAAYDPNIRREVLYGEHGHPVMAHSTACRYQDNRQLTIVLQNVVAWTGMLLFSASFYYVLARLVAWAAVSL
jgi:hypothetical protein